MNEASVGWAETFSLCAAPHSPGLCEAHIAHAKAWRVLGGDLARVELAAAQAIDLSTVRFGRPSGSPVSHEYVNEGWWRRRRGVVYITRHSNWRSDSFVQDGRNFNNARQLMNSGTHAITDLHVACRFGHGVVDGYPAGTTQVGSGRT